MAKAKQTIEQKKAALQLRMKKLDLQEEIRKKREELKKMK